MAFRSVYGERIECGRKPSTRSLSTCKSSEYRHGFWAAVEHWIACSKWNEREPISTETLGK